MKELNLVSEICIITINEDGILKDIPVDIHKFPSQKCWVGKKIGERIIKRNGKSCEIIKIVGNNLPPPPLPTKYPKRPTATPLPALTYKEVEKRFGIKISGFGRGINVNAKRDAVVLISSFDEKLGNYGYHDCWIDKGVYCYSGEGDCGDQELKRGNKAIVEAGGEGKTIHLIVKFSSTEYYYKGEYGLIEYKLEDEKDIYGNIRKEYKFILATDDEDVVE